MALEILRRPSAPTKAWVSAVYDTTDLGPLALYSNLNAEIFSAIEDSITGAFNGVEQIFAIHFAPVLRCDDPSTVRRCDSTSWYGGISGTGVANRPGTTQRMIYPSNESSENAATAAYFAAHEYGHRLGLEHPNPENWGRYDIMRFSATGVRLEGLLPYGPIQLVKLGWVEDSTLVRNVKGLEIPDLLSAEGTVFRVNTPDSLQSFYLANWQGHTEYDAKYGGTGLAIWHELRRANGPPHAWDPESAVGKLTLGVRNPLSGKDPLEANSTHLGTANDFFRASGNRACACGTNPSTALYASPSAAAPQSDTTSIAFENIHEDTSGNVVLDVFLTPEQYLMWPNAGDTAAVDLPNAITWARRDSACIVSAIGLVSDDAGASFDTLFADPSNTGTFSWTPAVIDSDYVLRLITHDRAGGTGISESGVFRVADRIAPSAVSDLLVEFVSSKSVGLTWTAPGDDSTSGTATQYDVRYSTSPITAANWGAAIQVWGESAPMPAGDGELLMVDSLTSCTTYYFAIKTRDESHNWSPLGVAPSQKTACWGGGGFAARPAGDASARGMASAAEGERTRLELDLREVEGAPQVNAVLVPVEGHSGESSGEVQVLDPDGRGGWRLRGGFSPAVDDPSFGVVASGRAATRLVCSDGLRVGRFAGTVAARQGGASQVLEAWSSRSGDVSDEVDVEHGGSPDILAGDTLRVRYARSASSVGEPVILQVVKVAGPPGAPAPPSATETDQPLPGAFSLRQSEPNPFTRSATIRFDILRPAPVQLAIFDLQGRLVRSLADGLFGAGRWHAEWDRATDMGTQAPAGIYLYRLTSGAFESRRKLVVLP